MSLTEVLAVIIVALVATVCAMGVWVHTEALKIDSLKSSNSALMLANTDFKAVVDDQNKAVEQLRADEKTLSDRAAQAQISAQTISDSYTALAKQTQHTRLIGEPCKAAEGLFTGYVVAK